MRTSKQCEVAGCERRSKGKGKCAVHLRRQRLGQALDAPIRNWVPCKLDNPCLVEGCSIRSILEHRWIMSEHIGRPLSRTELVHHKNGDRQDNRIDNLELCDNSQPPGQRVCDKISWMKEFLYIYGFDVVERNYPGWIS